MSYITGMEPSSGDNSIDIDLVPGADITYGQTDGILTGGGHLDGWMVENWGLFNSIKESATNGNFEFDVNIDAIGQKYAYYYQDYLDTAPYIYQPVVGDFNLTVKVDSTNGGDAQRSPCIGIGRQDDGGIYNAHCTMEMLGWNGTQARPTAGARHITNAKLYDGALVTYPHYIGIKRSGQNIIWLDSVDGENWTERYKRTVDVGNKARLFIAFGGQGGTANKMWLEKIQATFENPPKK